MRKKESISLDLNEEVRIFIRQKLKTFREEYPESRYEIVCWVDDLVSDTAREIYDYLAENECPSLLKTGGDIIGKNRTTFFRMTKKKGE